MSDLTDVTDQDVKREARINHLVRLIGTNPPYPALGAYWDEMTELIRQRPKRYIRQVAKGLD